MAQIRERNRIPGVLRQIARINEREAHVGVFEDIPNLARIAALNEFGVDETVTPELYQRLRALAKEHGAPTEGIPKVGERYRVPERSFLRATADESVELMREMAAEAVSRMMDGELDAYDALMETGKAMQRAVIDRVARGEGFDPLDPFTVAITGERRPLIGKRGVFETTQGIRVRVVRKS